MSSPNYGSMSRKRLKEIQDLLVTNSIPEDTVENIMDGICKIIHYNPEQITYTKEKGKGQMAWRAKKAEELGVSKASIARGYYKKLKD